MTLAGGAHDVRPLAISIEVTLIIGGGEGLVITACSHWLQSIIAVFAVRDPGEATRELRARDLDSSAVPGAITLIVPGL
jgi:hypothetical protein